MRGLAALAVYLLSLVPICRGSVGDRMQSFRRCLNGCLEMNCTAVIESKNLPMISDPQYNLLVWDCPSECKYSCMWETVAEFEAHNVSIQQFYGKWPFVRFLGMQEPASVLFSLLNAAAHLYGILWLRRTVSSTAPMYWTWHCYCLVALHTWFWSAVFHTRDLDVTEKMDYFCATALVMFQLYCLFARLLVFWPRRYLVVVSLVVLSLCVRHIYRMALVHFDYGYHIKVNVTIGVTNAVGWFLWCILGMCHDKARHVWKSYTSILLAGAFLSLEVLDFPPLFWVLDAHSLWHAGTAPLTLLWYSFVVDDCTYLMMYGTAKTSLHID